MYINDFISLEKNASGYLFNSCWLNKLPSFHREFGVAHGILKALNYISMTTESDQVHFISIRVLRPYTSTDGQHISFSARIPVQVNRDPLIPVSVI